MYYIVSCYISNLIYCFAGVIFSPQRGTQCAELAKIIIIRRVEGLQGQRSEIVGVTKREGNEVGKLELKRWVLRFFLKDATEGLFLIWKGKEFQRTGS